MFFDTMDKRNAAIEQAKKAQKALDQYKEALAPGRGQSFSVIRSRVAEGYNNFDKIKNEQIEDSRPFPAVIETNEYL